MAKMTADEIDDVYDERYRRGLGDCLEDNPDRRDVESYAEHEARCAIAAAQHERDVNAVLAVEFPDLTEAQVDYVKNLLRKAMGESWYSGRTPMVEERIRWCGKDHIVLWTYVLTSEGVELILSRGRHVKMTMPEWYVLAKYIVRDASHSQETAKQFFVQTMRRVASSARDAIEPFVRELEALAKTSEAPPEE